MPKSTVEEDSPYPIPENVLLPLQLQSCEAVTVNYTNKKGDPASFHKWEWTFLVGDGEYAGLTIRGNTEPKVTNASEASFQPLARPLVEALLGRSLELGEEVDTDLLVGLKCQGTVKHLEPRARKNGDGFWFNVEVDEVFPAYGDNVTAGAVAADAPPF